MTFYIIPFIEIHVYRSPYLKIVDERSHTITLIIHTSMLSTVGLLSFKFVHCQMVIQNYKKKVTLPQTLWDCESREAQSRLRFTSNSVNNRWKLMFRHWTVLKTPSHHLCLNRLTYFANATFNYAYFFYWFTAYLLC